MFNPQDGAINPKLIQEAYQNYFDEIAPNTFNLFNFFASQSLAGGYLIMKQQKQNNKAYYPYVLTDEGSVFVLKLKDRAKKAKAEEFIE